MNIKEYSIVIQMKICQFCGNSFRCNYRLQRHLNSKKPCFFNELKLENRLDLYTDEEKELFNEKELKRGYAQITHDKFKCIMCDYIQDVPNNLPRHVAKHCKGWRERIIASKQEEVKDLPKIKRLEQEIEELKANIKVLNEENKKGRRNIIVQNIFSGNVNLNITPIGLEDTSFIDENTFKRTIENPEYTYANLTKMLNFNKNRLYNWNIHRTDERFITYLDFDGRWKVKHKKDFVEVLFSIRENQSANLEKKFFINRYRENIDENTRKTFEALLKQVEEGTLTNEIFIKENKKLIMDVLSLKEIE